MGLDGLKVHFRRANLVGRFPILLSVLLLFCCQSSLAQVSAILSGVVKDQSGAALSRAEVTAENVDTGFTRQTVTDQEGRYQLFALPLGQ